MPTRARQTAGLAAGLALALAAAGCQMTDYERLDRDYKGPYAAMVADLASLDPGETAWIRGRADFPLGPKFNEPGEAVVVAYQKTKGGPVERLALLICRVNADDSRELVARRVVFDLSDWSEAPRLTYDFLPTPPGPGDRILMKVIEENYLGAPVAVVAVLGPEIPAHHRTPVWIGGYHLEKDTLQTRATMLSYQRGPGLQVLDFERNGVYEIKLLHSVLSDAAVAALGSEVMEPEWPSLFRHDSLMVYVEAPGAHMATYEKALADWHEAYVLAQVRGAEPAVLAEYAYYLGRLHFWTNDRRFSQLLLEQARKNTTSEAIRAAAARMLDELAAPPPERNATAASTP